MRTDTPDEIFDKFTRFSVSLSDDAITWPIRLCYTFLLALTTDLSEYTTEDPNFIMPNLTTLTTKALQLEALCNIRLHASKSFRNLSKQKK